jgi:hypothetical protein
VSPTGSAAWAEHDTTAAITTPAARHPADFTCVAVVVLMAVRIVTCKKTLDQHRADGAVSDSRKFNYAYPAEFGTT